MTKKAIVWQALVKAVDRFNRSDDRMKLLSPRPKANNQGVNSKAASERAIAHRLAFYLEDELRGCKIINDIGPLTVDCEYNRHIVEEKTLAAEAERRIKRIVIEARRRSLTTDDDGFYVFSVAPDIVVHKRLTDAQNFLVIEVKKRSNPETEEYDDLKLKLFTKPKEGENGYGYRYGAWVVAEDKNTHEKRRLRICKRFANGVGKDLP